MIRFCELLLMVTPIMILLTVVDGSCYFFPPHITRIGSREIVKCVLDDIEYLVGSDFKTTDCYECICSKNGLNCCGFGIHAGTIHVPVGYKQVQEGCEFSIVRDKGEGN